MHSVDKVAENVEKIASLFPNCITECMSENGGVKRTIDFDMLRQELSGDIVEGLAERYQFTWPDKKKAILAANAPINKTLRPCREESVDFDNTENLYIEGDNLEVLKLLQETYLGKIKMIYIDPPYNTGNDFVYNDDFAESAEEYMLHSGMYDEDGNRLVDKFVANTESNGRFHTDWLNMMYPRLKLAKDLLADDGVIFISIDDNEVENLRKIGDEIFGKENFIAHIIHKNNSMKNQSKFIGVSSEFVLIFTKDKQVLLENQPEWRVKKKGAKDVKNVFQQLKDKGYSLEDIHSEIQEMYSRPKYAHMSRWNKVDEFGVYKDADLSRANGPKDYTIVNPYTGIPCVVPKRGWGKSYKELLRLQKENLIYYGDGSKAPGMKSYLTEESESVLDNFVYVDSSVDKRSLEEMFGCTIFEYPKPVELIRVLLSLCTINEIVLDFFSGSATTAHAVIKLNAEDGGKRKFIMVQLPEECDENSEAYKAGYKNICEIGKERIRRAGKKIKEESPLTTQDLDIGFRVLKLDSSNMEDVYYTPKEYMDKAIDLFADNVKSDRSAEDLLFQVMLDLGTPLSSKIEKRIISGKTVYDVAEGHIIACFDTDVNDEVVTEIAKEKPSYFVMRDSSLADDSVAINFEQIFATYSPNTERRIL